MTSVRTLRRRSMIATAAAAVVLALGAGSAYAAPGEFDNAWGTGGELILPSPNATDDAWDVAVQPDGKIVVVGDSGPDAVVWRYTQAGVPDPDFNGGAPLTVDSGGSEILFEVAFAPDGKIVVAGQTSNGSDGVVYRINTNGTLDMAGFGGGDGKIEVGLPGGFIQIQGVVVQADNKIVATGQSGATTNAVVWRFEASGSPDLSFDDDGIQEVDAGGTETGQSVAIASDGGIIGLGDTSVANNGFLFKLDPVTGDLDTAGFGGGDGKHELDSGGSEQLLGMALQPDGRIVAVGLTSVNNDGVVYRVNANGTPDNSFDNDGAFGLDSGGTEQAQDVAIQPDGKLVVAGGTTVASSAAIYRINSNGGLDSTFDGDGALGYDNGGSEAGLGVALQADRKILMAGNTNNPATSGYVVRVLGDDPIVNQPPAQTPKKKCKKKKKKKKGKAAAKKCKKKKKKKK
jgi:uncharacterized delta-60 repeat protein